MEQVTELVQSVFIPLSVPIMGWLAVVIKDLNKTISDLKTQSAVTKSFQETCASDRRDLYGKTDVLEKDVAELKGRCSAYRC